MGEDWNHKKNRQYRHVMQNKAMKLGQQPLFEVEETVEKRYVGQLLYESSDVCLGTTLNVMVTGPRARPALVFGIATVGYIDGESEQDIRGSVRKNKDWPIVLQFEVVEKPDQTNTVILSPRGTKSGRC